MSPTNGTGNQPIKRKRARGKPLRRTEAQLDKVSQVTEVDIDYAKALVQRASPLLARLLAAKGME